MKNFIVLIADGESDGVEQLLEVVRGGAAGVVLFARIDNTDTDGEQALDRVCDAITRIREDA